MVEGGVLMCWVGFWFRSFLTLKAKAAQPKEDRSPSCTEAVTSWRGLHPVDVVVICLVLLLGL